MTNECPIRFANITPQQLKESLKNKTPVIIESAYMGYVPMSIPIMVTELKNYGADVNFKAETTLKGKIWTCCGYITPSNKEGYGGFEGVMTTSLKKS